MALIGSDMLRSILELAYPLVTLTSGDVSPDSTYCQVGGFFMAYFFGSSDFMVFIIGIYTAVYVFNPKRTQAANQGGLWRWRYYIFALWFTIPGLLAGLAFINPTAYVPLVTWCYLPPRPLVWRYTLAWGPRYFILLTISVLYVTLYIYVRLVYRTIDRNQSGTAGSSEYGAQRLSYVGSHQSDLAQTIQFPPLSYLQQKRPSITPSLLEDIQNKSRPSINTSREPPVRTSESFSIQHTYNDTRPTVPFLADLRNMFIVSTVTDGLPTSIRNSTRPTNDLSFNQRRVRVERQMRNLFIFPIVYFIMWIPPFINHVYQVIIYDSNRTSLPPGTFVVTVVATIFLPAQGFVNVCVYAVRERPWRRRKQNSTISTSSRPTTFSGEEKIGEPHPMESQAQIVRPKLSPVKISDPLQAAYTRRDIEEIVFVRTQPVDQRPQQHNWWDIESSVANKV
jgi:G protein-coupled receptor GPR1